MARKNKRYLVWIWPTSKPTPHFDKQFDRLFDAQVVLRDTNAKDIGAYVVDNTTKKVIEENRTLSPIQKYFNVSELPVDAP